MITVRHDGDRGTTRLDWLDSRHTFSFGDYVDPAHMGFGSLRVINEDRVAAGGGFPTHGHRDMEILTWVLDGALAHRDSLGNGTVIGPGELQRMTAGTGIQHSEFNASQTEPVHFLQIWIIPDRRGLPPGYAQQMFPADALQGRLHLLASGNGRLGSLPIHQDVDVWGGRLANGESVTHRPAPGRRTWLQMTGGRLRLGDRPLEAGDGAALAIGVDEIRLGGVGSAEVLLFDLA